MACLVLAVAALTPARADLPSQLEAIVNAKLNEHAVPGAVVGVWRGDATLALFEAGVGDLDGMTPISATDHFRIGSVTKSFTVTRLLQLAETGAIDLDNPISDYVPGTQNGTATLRQLANMTSGIFNYTEDTEFVQEWLDDLSAPWTEEELVAVADRNDPYFAPGGGWHYSNTNTVLLGMVIGQVTGESLAQQLGAHVLGPLGLTETLYPVSTDIPEPFSHGYALLGDPGDYTDFTISNPTASAGSGAMISTIEDMRQWGVALATGALLTPAMQAERLALVPTDGGIGPEYDGYGLGIGSLSGWLGHTGDYLGYQSLVMHDPVFDQTVVILTNLLTGDHVPTEIFREMAPLLVIPEPSALTLILVPLIAFFAWHRHRHLR